MKRHDDLELNAFVDGELSGDQQAEILEAMRDDNTLARAACELGQLKATVRLAYAEPPRPQRRAAARVRESWRAIAAGVVLLAVGMLSGWLLHSGAPTPQTETHRFVVLDPDGSGQAPVVAAQAQAQTRIVFHVTQADPDIAGELLDEVEQMLHAYENERRPLRVEVVSHSDGLDLLRVGLSAHQQRIQAMAGRFANLTFVACQNTIDRLRVENGIEVELVPGAELTESGVSHVVERQQQGWSYIRV